MAPSHDNPTMALLLSSSHSPPSVDRRPAVAVVWLKRDLRLQDHAALHEALQTGAVVVLVAITEPSLWHQPEFSPSQWAFQREALIALEREIRARGGVLLHRVGDAVEQWQQLHRDLGFSFLFAHEETGTQWTYDRDRRVRHWCRQNGVVMIERPQNGVVRRLSHRDGWSREWHRRMEAPLLPAPISLAPRAQGSWSGTELQTWLHSLPSPPLPGVHAFSPDTLQQGIPEATEAAARNTLEQFLMDRGRWYSRRLSSPVTAPEACSRLSAYLSFGVISMRQIWQRSETRRRELAALAPAERSGWSGSLRAFQARLHWHCHFCQKLEDEPALEFRNLHRACDGLRQEVEPDPVRLAAWTTGRTGHPLVDACLRSVAATGWLTFRMRALIVSYASYDLWLHWRHTAPWLARQFLDFEAGIHYAQFQMQSGTTGINTLRMYHPAKQFLDHDPEGKFVRQWVPELARVPLPLLATPWKLGIEDQRRAGVRIVPGGPLHSTQVDPATYPCPLVDHAAAIRQARDAFSHIRQQTHSREQARAIAHRHGSRKDTRGALQQDPVRRTLHRKPTSHQPEFPGLEADD